MLGGKPSETHLRVLASTDQREEVLLSSALGHCQALLSYFCFAVTYSYCLFLLILDKKQTQSSPPSSLPARGLTVSVF